MADEKGNAPDTAADSDQHMPGPHPALRKLERFVGSWTMTGRTLDSDTDNVHAKASFEWLPGGHFLVQRFEADFMGMEIKSLELIGYDAATDTYPSTVFSNMAGMPLPYRWTLDGEELTISAEAMGSTFRGRWNEDGTVFSGGWRADPGHEENPANIPYDIAGTSAG
jgi:hypothetical protein